MTVVTLLVEFAPEIFLMKKAWIVSLLILVAGAGLCLAQFGGGVIFSEQAAKARAEQAERQERGLSDNELPPPAPARSSRPAS